jgi:prepilin-type N-terminal cleavage/methylation domain-containing protein
METKVRKTQQENKLNNRQQGLTLVELLVVLAIIAVISAVALTSLENATSSQKQNTELALINILKAEANKFRKHRAQNGSTVNLTNVNTLSSNGYNVSPLTDGVEQNAYGNTITITTVNNGSDFTITSDVGTDRECAYFSSVLAGGDNVAIAPSCSGSVFSITYD